MSDTETNTGDKYLITKKNKLKSQTSYEEEDDDDEKFSQIKPKIPTPVPLTTVTNTRSSIISQQQQQQCKQEGIENIYETKQQQQQRNLETKSIEKTKLNEIYNDKIDNYHYDEQIQEEQHRSRQLNTFRPIVPARKLSPTPSLLQIRSRSHGVTNAPERFSIMKDLKNRSLAISNTNLDRIDGNNRQMHKKYTTGQLSNNNVNTYDFDSDESEFSTMSKNSALSTQSEQPKGAKSKFSTNNVIPSAGSNNKVAVLNNKSKISSTAIVEPSTVVAGSLNKVNTMLENDKKDGTMSDSALSSPAATNNLLENKKRRPSMAKALVILGLSKKSSSACNLSFSK
jgi:hypothetical protein